MPGPGNPPAVFTADAAVAWIQNVDTRTGAVVLAVPVRVNGPVRLKFASVGPRHLRWTATEQSLFGQSELNIHERTVGSLAQNRSTGPLCIPTSMHTPLPLASVLPQMPELQSFARC